MSWSRYATISVAPPGLTNNKLHLVPSTEVLGYFQTSAMGTITGHGNSDDPPADAGGTDFISLVRE